MNEVTNIDHNDIMNNFQKTDNILKDVQNIIEASQREAYRVVNIIFSRDFPLSEWKISNTIVMDTL